MLPIFGVRNLIKKKKKDFNFTEAMGKQSYCGGLYYFYFVN